MTISAPQSRFEEMMMDFADEPPELQKLINIVADYNVHRAHLLVEKLGANRRSCI